jgi:hypothetical protein
MALGEFTKQIAQQAILSATSKDPAPPPAAQASQAENLTAVFLGQVNAMQRALKEDEELAVYYQSGPERLRVMEIFAPSRQVAVLTGTDADRNLTRVIAAAESLQLVCKITKVQPGAKASRVTLVTPKPKDSNG